MHAMTTLILSKLLYSALLVLWHSRCRSVQLSNMSVRAESVVQGAFAQRHTRYCPFQMIYSYILVCIWSCGLSTFVRLIILVESFRFGRRMLICNGDAESSLRVVRLSGLLLVAEFEGSTHRKVNTCTNMRQCVTFTFEEESIIKIENSLLPGLTLLYHILKRFSTDELNPTRAYSCISLMSVMIIVHDLRAYLHKQMK